MRDDDDDNAGGEKGSPSKKVSSSTLDHTVIPFSIAIKRMSEILIYKANECKAKVSNSHFKITEEASRTDILFLKHDSSIFRQSFNPVCGFSMMDQVNRLCAVCTTEN